MGKVICFFTKREVTEFPVSKADGEALIENLLRFEIQRNPTLEWTDASHLLGNITTMIENASGASRFDVMERYYHRRKV